jgi:pyruvate/2-oxoglutarate dehydrogenase complex dihydrolipoamide dehydrogenase (E3) component
VAVEAFPLSAPTIFAVGDALKQRVTATVAMAARA